MQNAMEKSKTKYANANTMVDDHATNNRLLFLFPHTFHDAILEKAVADKLDSDAAGTAAFCPGKFLKEKILDQITSVQVLIFGNTSERDAVDFCKTNIVSKFKVVECGHND